MPYQAFGSEGQRVTVRKTFCSCRPFTVKKSQKNTNGKLRDGMFLCVASSMVICLTWAAFSVSGQHRKSGSCGLQKRCLFTIKESICQHDLIKYLLHILAVVCSCVYVCVCVCIWAFVLQFCATGGFLPGRLEPCYETMFYLSDTCTHVCVSACVLCKIMRRMYHIDQNGRFIPKRLLLLKDWLPLRAEFSRFHLKETDWELADCRRWRNSAPVCSRYCALKMRQCKPRVSSKSEWIYLKKIIRLQEDILSNGMLFANWWALKRNLISLPWYGHTVVQMHTITAASLLQMQPGTLFFSVSALSNVKWPKKKPTINI